MIFCSSSFNSGSRCWSACADAASTQHRASTLSRSTLGPDISDGILRGDFRRFGRAPRPILELAVAQGTIADDDAMRDAHQFRIGEFHPGPGVAIIEQYIDARGLEVPVELIGGLA